MMTIRGGKAAMSVALHPSLADPSNDHLLSNLVIADVSPIQGQISPEFKGYIARMQKIEQMKLRTRREAAAVLESYEKVRSLLGFVLFHLSITGSRYTPVPVDQP